MPIGEGLRALVLEDDPQILLLITKVLGAHGFQVDPVTNGLEGLVRLEAKLPDLILCDWMMPELDGMTFARAVKASAGGKHVPIIFVTAKDDAGSRAEGMRAGACEYLTKPFRRDDLVAAVKRALASRPSGLSY